MFEPITLAATISVLFLKTAERDVKSSGKEVPRAITVTPIIKGEIIAAIDTIEDKELRILLIYRYIDCISWQEIAEKLFVSNSTLKRWHIKALSLLKI
jgi:DNA-directed RNA polymerase specialized sigma subunit